MAWEKIPYLNGYICSETTYTTPPSSQQSSYTGFITEGDTPITFYGGTHEVRWDIVANNALYVTVDVHPNGQRYVYDYRVYLGNTEIYDSAASYYIALTFTDLAFFINHDAQEASVCGIRIANDGENFISDGIQNQSFRQNLYTVIKDAIRPPYNWESVISISGNDNTYILSQIASASINDGDPVTGAGSSAFSVLNNDSKVDVLVQNALEEVD